MSVQFYCCVFSSIDQFQEPEVPLILVSLHVLVVLYGAVVLIDYTDRRTALDERSSIIDHLPPMVDMLLQLSVPLPLSLSGRLPVDASTDVPATYCLNACLLLDTLNVLTDVPRVLC